MKIQADPLPLFSGQPKLMQPSYSFKCHRHDLSNGGVPQGIVNHATTVSHNGAILPSQYVFAVNDICFHKEYETFCTAGSDGAITFWDGMGRTKLKGELLP